MNKNQSNKATLRENEGISSQETTNKDGISNLKRKRQEQPSVEELLKGILKSNTTALSRGITLIESQNLSHKSKANALIQGLLRTHKAFDTDWYYRRTRSRKKHLHRSIRYLLNQPRQ